MFYFYLFLFLFLISGVIDISLRRFFVLPFALASCISIILLLFAVESQTVLTIFGVLIIILYTVRYFYIKK